MERFYLFHSKRQLNHIVYLTTSVTLRTLSAYRKFLRCVVFVCVCLFGYVCELSGCLICVFYAYATLRFAMRFAALCLLSLALRMRCSQV